MLKHRQLIAARLQVQVNQRNQHQQRADEGIEEELDGGVHPARSAPHADDDEHRQQHRFPKHVEEHTVERREHPDHQAFEDQERRHVLRHALLDVLPAGNHDQHGGKGGQQNQRHRNTIDADVELRMDGRNPWRAFHELHFSRSGLEPAPQRNAQNECQHAHHQRHPLRERVSVAQGQHHEAAHDGQPDQPGQQVRAQAHRQISHNSSAANPKIMAKA